MVVSPELAHLLPASETVASSEVVKSGYGNHVDATPFYYADL